MLSSIKLSLLRGISKEELFSDLSVSDAERLLNWGSVCGISDIKRLCDLAWQIENEGGAGVDQRLVKASFELFHDLDISKCKKESGRGKFIVFEGLDGSGKGTQFDLCAKHMEKLGKLYTTFEPTQSCTGGIIRDVLGGFSNRTQYELASLFLADRISHCTNQINGLKRYLNNGINVLCDRYYYSSFAYQGTECDMDWLINAHYGCPEIIKPDLCIFLDVNPSVCCDRISKGRLHVEIFENIQKLQSVRNKFAEAFEKINEAENIVIISADRSIDEVAAEISAIIDKLCG